MPFGPYKDFAACVRANKSKKSPEGYCAALHRKILGRWPGQSESYSDPLVIDQPVGTKLQFSLSQHLIDPMSEQERKSILFDIIRCKEQNKEDVFISLWSEMGLEYAELPIPEVNSKQDLSVYISEVSPKLSTIDISKVVFRCSYHMDFTIQLSEGKYINWELAPDSIAVQYLESGDVIFPIRDKVTDNKMGDMLVAEHGTVISDFEDQSESILVGEAALGISTDDYHEYFIWHLVNKSEPRDTEDYIHLPVAHKEQFVDGAYRVIDIDAKRGIKAVVGKYKSNPGGTTHVQKFLFPKSKGWDMKKAKSWMSKHGKPVVGVSEDFSGRWTIRYEDDAWVVTHPRVSTSPMILASTDFIPDLQPLFEEAGISNIAFSPELIPILEADELGKQWLSGIDPEKIKSIYAKYAPKPVESKVIPSPTWTITVTPGTDIKWITSGTYVDNDITYTTMYNSATNSIVIIEESKPLT